MSRSALNALVIVCLCLALLPTSLAAPTQLSVERGMLSVERAHPGEASNTRLSSPNLKPETWNVKHSYAPGQVIVKLREEGALAQEGYVGVKVRNEGRLWSEAGISSGVVAGPTECPTAYFTASPVSGPAPLMVEFANASTGSITSYLWDLGDGSTSALQSPIHTYTRTGVYTVSLQIVGPGGSDTFMRPGYITVTPAISPTASFTAALTSGIAPLTVTFTAITSGTVERWLWEFGDGGTAQVGPVVTHTYIAGGVFDVSLTVSNTHGSFTVGKPGYISVTESAGHKVYLPLVLKNYSG